MPSGRYPNNSDAVNALPDIVRTGQSRAFLLNLDTNQRWDFLLNPQEIPYLATVTYVTANLIGVNQQPVIWTSTDGLFMELSDLILDTTIERKSVRSAIDRLVELGKATPSLGRPPLLSFVCGEHTFSQCVLAGDITWTELATVNGVAVRARLSFSLRKAGVAAPLITLPTIEAIPSTTNSGGIPIPRPSPVPTPTPEPGTTPTPSPSPSPSPGPTPAPGVPTDESGIDRIGFGAGISLNGASAFAISSSKVLTAAHMVRSVGESVRLVLKGDDATVEKTVNGTVQGINQGLDAAWIQCPENSFDIWWELGNEGNLKDGDLCLAYGHPAGGSPNQEKTRGVFRRLGSGSNGVVFGMPDPKTRLLYPGNSGGAITCGQKGSSEFGKIISLTSGGDGRPSQPAPGQNVQLQGSVWQTDKVYGPRITQVKAAFNL